MGLYFSFGLHDTVTLRSPFAQFTVAGFAALILNASPDGSALRPPSEIVRKAKGLANESKVEMLNFTLDTDFKIMSKYLYPNVCLNQPIFLTFHYSSICLESIHYDKLRKIVLYNILK